MNRFLKYSIFLFLSYFGGQESFAQEIEYCPSYQQDDACDLYRIDAIRILDSGGKELISKSDISCEENWLGDDCLIINKAHQYNLEINTRINPSVYNSPNLLGQRIKIWADWNSDGKFDEEENIYDSELYSSTNIYHQASFIIPEENILDAQYMIRIRTGLRYISESTSTDFGACEFIAYSDIADYSVHIISHCPETKPGFKHEISETTCKHSFIPEINQAKCFNTYQYAWSITAEDEEKEYIYYEGEAVATSAALKKTGLYEICLQTIKRSPDGLYCVSHHCQNYWNNESCSVEDPGNTRSQALAYPSVMTNILHIALATEMIGNEQIIIYNYNGELLQNIKPQIANLSVDVSQYPTGYYLIKIIQGNQNQIKRLVKILD